jgi:hypothetical protein
MTLFALLGIPCFTLMIGALADAWGSGLRSTSTFRARVVQFVKGAGFAIPVVVVVLLLRRYVPVSYRFLLLYLYGALIDHLLPTAILALGCLLWFRGAGFHELLFFCGGFFSLISLATTTAGYGEYEAHALFLLPALRMGIVVLLPLLLLRVNEWYGVVRLLCFVLLAAVPLGAGAVSYLYARYYSLAAILLSAAFLGGGVLFCYLDSR